MIQGVVFEVLEVYARGLARCDRRRMERGGAIWRHYRRAIEVAA